MVTQLLLLICCPPLSPTTSPNHFPVYIPSRLFPAKPWDFVSVHLPMAPTYCNTTAFTVSLTSPPKPYPNSFPKHPHECIPSTLSPPQPWTGPGRLCLCSLSDGSNLGSHSCCYCPPPGLLQEMAQLENREMIQSFQTNRSGQTVQSDQGLHCLLCHLHLFDEKHSGLTSLYEF